MSNRYDTGKWWYSPEQKTAWDKSRIADAEFWELVANQIYEIADRREDLEEYFARKDSDELNGTAK